MTADVIIQIAGVCIIALAIFHLISLSYSFIRSDFNKRRQWKAELDVFNKRVELHTLNYELSKNKLEGAWQGYRKFRIQKKEFEKQSGICSFYLVPHDGKSIPSFEPGQYLFFKIKIPTQNKPLLRCYSLSSSPFVKDYYRVSIKHVLPPKDNPNVPSGIVSSYFHEQLNEGDIVDVRAPGGIFCLDLLSHKPVVLIGCGVGITPVLSMLNALSDMGSKREVWFFLGVRNNDEHIMEDHLKFIAEHHENFHVVICYSSPKEQDIVENRFHHSSRVNIALLKKVLPSNNYEFYFCGPNQMMDELEAGLLEWKVPKSSVHFERFFTESDSQPIVKVEKEIAIQFDKSGKSLVWDGTSSVLDIAEKNSIAIDYSCKRGMCGLCQTAIKQGGVKYNDPPPEYLADLEDGMCLPCVAIPEEGLVLDA